MHGPLIAQIWISFTQEYFEVCVMVDWNRPSGSGGDFQKLSIYFQFAVIISP